MNTVESILIEPARAADVPAIERLLSAAELPHGDVGRYSANFLVARDGSGSVIGAVGAEVHPPAALLRSLVVAPGARGRGIAEQLLRAIDAAGRQWGVEEWWLLTTTAAGYFEARGFERAARTAAPLSIQGTEQFTGGCPCSAVCLTRARRANA